MKVQRFRFAYLLAALVLVAFVRPFLDNAVVTPAIVDLMLFVALLAGAYAATERKVFFVPVVVLGAVSAAVQAAFVVSGVESLAVAFVASSLLFYAAVAWAIARALFGQQRHVTSDTLCQAVSVYLLLGLVWAMGYSLLETAVPGSFVFDGIAANESSRFARFAGYSFATLTTVGYGNIAPASSRADAMSSLQALVGQIYIAVVIARLVAIQLAESFARESGGDRG